MTPGKSMTGECAVRPSSLAAKPVLNPLDENHNLASEMRVVRSSKRYSHCAPRPERSKSGRSARPFGSGSSMMDAKAKPIVRKSGSRKRRVLTTRFVRLKAPFPFPLWESWCCRKETSERSTGMEWVSGVYRCNTQTHSRATACQALPESYLERRESYLQYTHHRIRFPAWIVPQLDLQLGWV